MLPGLTVTRWILESASVEERHLSKWMHAMQWDYLAVKANLANAMVLKKKKKEIQDKNVVIRRRKGKGGVDKYFSLTELSTTSSLQSQNLKILYSILFWNILILFNLIYFSLTELSTTSSILSTASSLQPQNLKITNMINLNIS